MPATVEPPWDVRQGPPPPPTDDGHGGDDGDRDRRHRWVTLATFLHPAEAHIARLRLEAAGVACVLLDEMMAATNCLALAIGGVKLQVPAADAERAGVLLRRFLPDATAAAGRLSHAAPSPRWPRASPRRWGGVGGVGGDATVAASGSSWTLRVDPDAEVAAARALADSPFGGGLTDLGFHLLASQPCPTCGLARSRNRLATRVVLAVAAVARRGRTPAWPPCRRRRQAAVPVVRDQVVKLPVADGVSPVPR